MRKYIQYLVVFLCAFYSQDVLCCINEYRALITGELKYTEAKNSVPTGHFNSNDKSYLLERLHYADSIYKFSGKLEDYSDVGSMHIYNGHYSEAMKIF